MRFLQTPPRGPGNPTARTEATAAATLARRAQNCQRRRARRAAARRSREARRRTAPPAGLLLRWMAEYLGTRPAELVVPNARREAIEGRALFAVVADHFGIDAAATAAALGCQPRTVAATRRRGNRLAIDSETFRRALLGAVGRTAKLNAARLRDHQRVDARRRGGNPFTPSNPLFPCIR